jgi:hypothetical protein
MALVDIAVTQWPHLEGRRMTRACFARALEAMLLLLIFAIIWIGFAA